MPNQQAEIQELKQALLKARQDIERLSSIKSDFVSIVSHELRTPLTSVKESISILLDGIAGPFSDNQKKFLEIAKNNMDRLIRTILDILDFSKLESGGIVMHKRKMDINELIRGVYKDVEDAAKKKNLEFNLVLKDDMELTWLDPDRIRQALLNLLSNAIKFNKENGSINVLSAVERVDGLDVVRVSVEDTGHGISKEDMPKLFKYFSPLDTAMTRSSGGVGLGLAISKGIIALHSGEIWAESKKDVGSKFIFTLPIYRKDEEFDFLLREAIERTRCNDLQLAIIIFEIRNRKDATEEAFNALEKDIKSVVRGPEDKVARFRNGEFIVIMAGTGRSGAEKIISRMKDKVKIALNFGVAVYPDDALTKDDLIKKAEQDLKSKDNL